MAKIIEVNDLSAPELLPYAGLTQAQLRNRLEPEKGLFIAESPKVIRTALESGFLPVSMLMEQKHIKGDAAGLLEICDPSLPVYTARRETLTALTGYTLTRGVLCAMKRPALPDPDAVLGNARRVAVLDNVVDSTNTGAIFRSAAALGMDAVLLTATCSDPLCRRSVRVSMGTVFQIQWTYLDARGYGALKAAGFTLAAMALRSDALPLDDPRLKREEKLAFVLGAEGDGLSEETIRMCDRTVRIPMAHGVDSLNVAAAAAVAFWELRGCSLRDPERDPS